MKRIGSRSYLKVGETGDDDRGCRTGRTGREVKMGEMQRLEVSDYSARTVRIANEIKNILLVLCRYRESFGSARSRRGNLRRRTSHQELPRQHVAGSKEHPNQTPCGPHRLPAPEQPD